VKIKIGVMGSADDALPQGASDPLRQKAEQLGRAIAGTDAVLLTGATTGLVHIAGQAAHEAGALHIGISPASNEQDHWKEYGLPAEACDAIVYTGFGLKGRNVVLVRSCDIVLFIAGSIGALNELTIAYDEGKIIGCLTQTGGVADEAARIVEALKKPTRSQIFYDDDPVCLVDRCVAEVVGKT
jgi:uncharacterized protein (TIGR00725 family)